MMGGLCFIQTILSLFRGRRCHPLLGILWKQANHWGRSRASSPGCSSASFLVRAGAFPSDDPFLYVAMFSFVFAMVVTVVVSLLTPPEPEDKIRGLVWGSVLKDTETQAALEERVSQ